MKTEEQIQMELEEAGLDVERDGAGNLRGVLMFQYSDLRKESADRGYLYPIRGGEAWGWLSEDVVFSDLAKGHITNTYPHISRGSHEDEPVVGDDRPELIISGELAEFVRMAKVVVFPGVVPRRKR